MLASPFISGCGQINRLAGALSKHRHGPGLFIIATPFIAGLSFRGRLVSRQSVLRHFTQVLLPGACGIFLNCLELRAL